MRQQCSGILLQYILDYPLGAKRLQHHLQFLITNLSFEHESGRQASVDTIKVRHTIQRHCCMLNIRQERHLVSHTARRCVTATKERSHGTVAGDLDGLASFLVSCGIVLLQA